MEAPREVTTVGSHGVLSGSTSRSRITLSLGFIVRTSRIFLSAAQHMHFA
jgi:hypothetical protein